MINLFHNWINHRIFGPILKYIGFTLIYIIGVYVTYIMIDKYDHSIWLMGIITSILLFAVGAVVFLLISIAIDDLW